MRTVTLRETTNPEAAEAAVYAALAASPAVVRLRVHGFPSESLSVLLSRLPAGYSPVVNSSGTEVRLVRQDDATPPALARKASGGRLGVTVMAGRYDAALDRVRAAFKRELAAGPAVVFTTEQGNRDRTAIINKAAKEAGYGVARVGVAGREAEQVILYDKDLAQPEGNEYSIKLTDGGGHNSQRFPIYATVQILRFADGHELAAIAVHMPSHLDKSSPYYFPVNLVLWRTALARLAREVRKLRRTHPGISITIGGDWNARQAAGWTAKALHKALPGFVTGSGDMFGNVWSLGLSRGKGKAAPARGSSDHVIHHLTYRWR